MIRRFGEAALLVELGETARVHALAEAMRTAEIAGVVATVPGIETLLIELDPLAVASADVDRIVERLLTALPQTTPTARRQRTIPVVYGGDSGPDLAGVAELTGLTQTQVVELHAGAELTVQTLGFAPGFAYLGDLPDALDVPRLATPRTRTPAGSVAIAGRRSGIYPAELPGGWRVIGRTPLCLFDARRDPPAYLAPGDRVRFAPMRADEWETRGGVPPDW